MANCMAYMGGYNRGYSSYDGSSSSNYQLQAEVNQLKSELNDLKAEMAKFKEFMSTKGSFTDFKVFKFNEDEEKRKKAEEVLRQQSQLINRLAVFR